MRTPEVLLDGLCSVRLWHRGAPLVFSRGGEGQVVLRWLEPDQRPRAYLLGWSEPPDRLVVPWAVRGGAVAEAAPPQLRYALLTDPPLLVDTRERRSGATAAVFRFATCVEPGHPGYRAPRVLCGGCLGPIRAAYAEGEERAAARDAVLAIQAMGRV